MRQSLRLGTLAGIPVAVHWTVAVVLVINILPYWLAKDPDLRPLRKHPIYRSIEDQIRKIKIKIKVG